MPQPLRIALLWAAIVAGAGLAGYVFLRALRRSDDPAKLIFRWCLTAVAAGWLIYMSLHANDPRDRAWLIPLVALPSAAVLIILWGRPIAEAFARPITSLFTGGDEEVTPQPFYSIAEARRRQGKFREAMYEIQAQLEKFPTDVTGQLMLAQIQAENVNDIAGAEVTIHRLCSQPKQSPNSIAAALNMLADWHLKYHQDVEAARAALQEIIERFPESDVAFGASNRIAHLADTDALLATYDRPVIKLKEGVEYLGMLKDQSHLLPPEPEPMAEAERLVKHLGEFPNDTEAREELAKLYAEKFGRLDLATDQLEQMIALPTESPRHIARWLNLLADFQVLCVGDTKLAAQTVQRIIDRFPTQSFADMARQRLGSIGLETRRFEKTKTVKAWPSPDGKQ